MSNNQLITKEWNNKTLTFREDGYFNMTMAAKQFGKQLINFWSNVSTTEYMLALAGTVDIHWDSNAFPDRSAAVDAARKNLTYAERGRHGGTYAHPKLAVFFARWLDVRFAVACDAMIEDILKGNAEVTITKPEESATMALPQDYLSALKALVASEEEKQQVLLENHTMSEKLNKLTIKGYLGLYHTEYFSTEFKQQLGKRSAKIMRSRGLEPDFEIVTFTKPYGGKGESRIGIYPKDIIDEAFEILTK